MNIESLLSPKVSALKSSGIRKFFDIVESMPDAVSLGVGEPDFVTPWHIREAGIYSLETGHTHYTSNSGLLKLREAVCDYLKRRFCLNYSVTQTLITVGGSEAIDAAMRAVLAPGDEVLIPEPSFVCYSPCAALAGGIPVPIVTEAKDDFRLTAAALKAAITPKTKLLVLPFPNNPTGAIMRKGDLEEIAAALRGTDIFVLSDEIYAELTYSDEPHVSFASIDDMAERTILISGFSKAFAMTGWRLGYACAHKSVIAAMTKIHQYAIMCSPTASQYAAVEAMKNGDSAVRAMVDEYNYRRRFILDGVRRLGLDCFEPFGAFYIFPSVKKTGLSSEAFCERLLLEEKVAVVPGNAFGDSGEGFVRCSYAYSMEAIEEALTRLGRFLSRL